MLTTVEVRTPQGALLTLSLDNPSNGYVVKGIDGLGPVKANLVTSSVASRDGVQFQSSRRESRDLMFKLGFSPADLTETVRGLRKKIYGFFLPKMMVNMRFYMSEGLVVDLNGMVETCEPAVFDQEPGVAIGLMCFDPDFFDPEVIEVTGESTSLTTEDLIHYNGEVESGILFTLNVDRTLTEFTIYHRPPDGSIRTLDFANPLEAGDKLDISTVPGSKYVNLTRSGAISSLLRGMSPTSNWIELQPGDNYIRVYATGAAIPWEISYTDKYGGL